MNLLGISGSLRAASLNSAYLHVAARLAPDGWCMRVHDAPAQLPMFNPDLDESLPRLVRDFRADVARADALVIASPEYAHGVSGAMKNALDWLVSDSRFVNKPVALVNTSPRAHHAYEALAETLRTMSARIIVDACVAVPLLGSGFDEAAMLRSAHVRATVQTLFAALGLALVPFPSTSHIPRSTQ